MRETVSFEEDMFGPAQPNTFGAKIFRRLYIERRFRICPDTERAGFVGPAHDFGEVARNLWLYHINFARKDLTGRAVHSDDITFFDNPPRDRELLGLLINADIACA